MKRNLLLSVAIAAIASLLTALPALAQTYLDLASGNETWATPTEGWFSGNATGQLTGSWSAAIIHTQLNGCTPPPGSTSCLAATIYDGSFTLNASIGTVTGHFQKGTVYQTSGFSGCGNQTYNVTGYLDNVGVGGGAGSGTFSAILTHYRFWCFTYGATVKPPIPNSPNISLSF